MRLLFAMLLLSSPLFSYHRVTTVKEDSGFVNVEEGKLFYHTYGSGPPVIVLHGGPGLDHNYLLPGMSIFCVSNKVIFYDQRGTGKSESPITEEFINLQTSLKDLETLRKSLKIEKFSLIGHSWGSILALYYSVLYPEQIDKLILIDPIPVHQQARKAFFASLQENMEKDSEKLHKIQASPQFQKGEPFAVEAFSRTLFKNYLYDPNKVTELNLTFSAHTARNMMPVFHLMEKSLGNGDFDLRPAISIIQAPMLVIHGEADPIPQESSSEIAALAPNGFFELIPNSGHYPYIEAPNELLAIIETFLWQASTN